MSPNSVLIDADTLSAISLPVSSCKAFTGCKGSDSKSSTLSVGSESDVMDSCLDLVSFLKNFFPSMVNFSSSSVSFRSSFSFLFFLIFVLFSCVDSVKVQREEKIVNVVHLIGEVDFKCYCSGIGRSIK